MSARMFGFVLVVAMPVLITVGINWWWTIGGKESVSRGITHLRATQLLCLLPVTWGFKRLRPPQALATRGKAGAAPRRQAPTASPFL